MGKVAALGLEKRLDFGGGEKRGAYEGAEAF